MTAIIKYAINKDSLQAIHINDAENGLACNCNCEKCNQSLIAVQGKSENPREWHFRHHIDTNCNGGQETALHQMAKQILVENLQIIIPKFGRINYSNAVAEKELVSIRPDVSAVYANQIIYFEVAVTHFNEPDKNQFFFDGKHRSVEINLSKTSRDISPEELKLFIICNTDIKRIIYWESRTFDIFKIIKENPIAASIVAIGTFLLIRSKLKSKK